MTPRTHEAIAFGGKGKLNGTYKLLCLENGRILKRIIWNGDPMPQQVINTVNKCGGGGQIKHIMGEILILGIALGKKLIVTLKMT